MCGQGDSPKPFITMSWDLDYQMIGMSLKQVLKCRNMFGIRNCEISCIHHGRIHLHLRWLFWHMPLIMSSPHLRGSLCARCPLSISCSLRFPWWMGHHLGAQEPSVTWLCQAASGDSAWFLCSDAEGFVQTILPVALPESIASLQMTVEHWKSNRWLCSI